MRIKNHSRTRRGNGQWNSFSDQAISGWVEAGPSATDLSELNPLSHLLVGAGDEFNLGVLFNPSGAQDLVFEFQIFGAPSDMLGVVTYGPILPGDFNRNGAVDAADYIVWRKSFGQNVARGALAVGNGDGIVDEADYRVWRAHFGATLAGGGATSQGSAVPEPSSSLLLLLALAAVLFARNCNPRSLRSCPSPRFSRREIAAAHIGTYQGRGVLSLRRADIAARRNGGRIDKTTPYP